MKRIYKIIPFSMLALSFAALVPAFAAHSDAWNWSPQYGERMSAQGELMYVDLDAKSFTIKTKDEDEELRFYWYDGTQVEGIKNGIQGLSSKEGDQVKVVYMPEQQGKMWATLIEVLNPSSKSAQEDPSARGELTNVNTDNQTFTIREENNQEVQFHYDSNTTVEGVKNGIKGLSSEKGTSVRVEYKTEMGKRMATRIEIAK